MTTKKPTLSKGEYMRAFAENAKALMEVKYEGRSNKPMALAKDAGISLSTVQRALSGETAPNLNTVEAICLAIGASPYNMINVDALPKIGSVSPKIISGEVIESSMGSGKIRLPSAKKTTQNNKE